MHDLKSIIINAIIFKHLPIVIKIENLYLSIKIKYEIEEQNIKMILKWKHMFSLESSFMFSI